MHCDKPGCIGNVEHGLCQLCGESSPPIPPLDDFGRQEVMTSVRSILQPREVAPSKEDLQRASADLRRVVPYNYEAWRLHADLLLNAICQLEKRQIEPDDSVRLFITPLREDQLRNAAERALRQCAHFADGTEKRIALIDEANRVRRTTWF